jgi:hypothetical protein
VLLVIDVGGGTTDFSAIRVGEESGSYTLERIAVGDHILLGGDNMDLALAHLAKQKLEADGKEVDRLQMAALVHAARGAKERLLGDASIASAPIAIAGRGSQLLGNALRTELSQEEVARTIVEGFFPVVPPSARVVRRARAGLTQLGLPYAQDAAVTRQLAEFLSKQAGAMGDGASMLYPTPHPLPRRRDEVAPARIAPRRGAHELVHRGGSPGASRARGRRSRSRRRHRRGTLRTAAPPEERPAHPRRHRARVLRRHRGRGPAVPGIEPPIVALCVAPFGMEEGSRAELPPEELGVVVGEPVRFRFFGSTVRRDDTAGTELDRWSDTELEELPPIEITLPPEGRREGDVVPVRLQASVTEIGTLALDAVPVEPQRPDERFRIELSVREGSST